MGFNFEYIFYRLTRLYIKWDGRGGVTSIVAIAMIQTVLLMIAVGVVLLVFVRVDKVPEYVEYFKYLIGVSYFLFSIRAYRKYSGLYNELGKRWGKESKKVSVLKGVGVLLSLLVPWILFGLMVVKKGFLSGILYFGSE